MVPILKAGPNPTTISDIVYRADGLPASGTLLISWPPHFRWQTGGVTAAGALTCGTPLGYTLTPMNVSANAPANSTGYFFGANMIDTNNTSFDAAKIPVPKSGTIKRIFIQQSVRRGTRGRRRT